MDENTLELRVVDTGAGDKPAPDVDGDAPADRADGSPDAPRYQKDFDEVIGRVSRGLLTFDEGLERVERILSRYKDEIVDFHREAGDKRSFEDISVSARQRVGAVSGEPVRVEPTGESVERQAKDVAEAAKLAKDKEAEDVKARAVAEDAAQFLKRIGLGNLSSWAVDSLSPPTNDGGAGSGFPPVGPPAAGGPASPSGGSQSEEAVRLSRLENMAKAGAYAASLGQVGGPGGTRASSLANAGVGIASTGVLGPGAAALAGGPAGLIALAAAKAADVVVDRVADIYKNAQRNLRYAADMTTGVVQDDPVGMLTKSADLAADTLERIPVVGKIYAEQLRTVTTALTAFQQVVSSVTDRARELKGYDANIAQSAAQADVDKLMLDINEAQRMGESYARAIDAEASIRNDMREIMLPIKEFVVTNLADFLQANAAILSTIKPFVETGITFATEGLTALKFIAGIVGLSTGTGIILTRLYKIFEESHKWKMEERNERAARGGRMAMDMLFNAANNGVNIPVAPRFNNDPLVAGLNLPLFGGP